jgi:hypothetical protein
MKFALWLEQMASKERAFSIRTAMLMLIIGSGIIAIAAALVVGWLSYREYRDRIGSSLIAASRAIMVSIDGEFDQCPCFRRRSFNFAKLC